MRAGLFVKRGIGEVHIFLVHALLGQGDCLAETLEMDNFALAQETDDVVDIRVIGEAENVVIGESGLLLWCGLVRTTFPPLVRVPHPDYRVSILFSKTAHNSTAEMKIANKGQRLCPVNVFSTISA